jgi:hypothetical protein
MCAEQPAADQRTRLLGRETLARQMEEAEAWGVPWSEDDLLALARDLKADGQLDDSELDAVWGGAGDSAQRLFESIAAILVGGR